MRQNDNAFKLNDNNEYINGSDDDNPYVIIVKNCSINAKKLSFISNNYLMYLKNFGFDCNK